ncbi:hypothetical protein EC957_005265 [Mortierella hygrophila]|uniref:TOG domain-containing protein n=1 Tax=Mortierella hygrophila TaxID=979708 RepID=A0A9P6FFA7_9FUNG|nr:hypothetical protein EC957_005265 [Mortierella hygrophila]
MLSSGAAASANLNYHDLDNILSQPETEHNWAQKETAIKTIGAACHISIGHNQDYVAFIKSHRKAFSESLLTERTRLSGAACELVEKLSTSMGRDFSLHFPDLFTPALLKVCARTNKVMVTRAVKALQSMINAGCLSTLPKACQAFATNNKTLRIACIGLIATCIAQFTSQELEAYLGSFEPVLKEGVSDAAPEVRDTSRKSFKVYAQKFPERSSALTAILPGNVLKYLLPDTRSSASLVRPVAGRITPTSGRAEGPGELSRHQSSREGLSRTVPSRIGPVRARTTTAAEQISTSFKSTTSSTPHAAPPSQLYGYSSSQNGPAQSASPHLGRNHGLPSRTGSLADTSDHSGHSGLRMGAQRSRALSSNSLTSTSMYQRTPSINLATHGGPQRMVPSSNSYSSDSAKPVRPSTISTRPSKVEPPSKGSRLSTISTNGPSTEREPMSASERAKAYSASLKNEMASRRAGDMGTRTSMGSRRVVTDPPGYGVYGPPTTISTPASSTASTAPVSAATSITSVSPVSSSSTSPTTAHSPHHDHLFSSFRAPASPHATSSPPESCASPDYRHSTPPSSQHSDENVHAAPLSPTRMAQVSLEGSIEPQALGSSGSPFHSRESSQEPHLGHYNSGHSSHHGSPQLHDAVHAENGDLEFSEPGIDADKDHDMTIPDHESLFGNTANYLQTEQEISALQQQTGDKSIFMEEDIHLIDHDQLAVKAYADDYEASLAAASCSSTSLASSIEGEKSYAE